MNHYIKNQNRIIKNKKCSLDLINSKNTYLSYNKYLDPQFVVGSPTFIETINFSIGKNVYTKPYNNL
jgi:hypothetical protein